MTKIGILSMQRIKNYGSFLQSYGLKEILKKLGYNNIEFVDYHVEPSIIQSNKNNNGKINKLKSILKGKAPIKQKLQYILHKKNFGKKYYPILGLIEKPNYNPKLDTLIIGSDEVFNCIQENPNVGYSLELFGKDNNAKRLITYAASFGNTTNEKLKKYGKEKEISNLLNKFDAISVRDSNSGRIIEELTSKNVRYNLDPVLMYNYMNECELIPDIDINEKYMIVYAYAGRISDEESNYIIEYAKKNQLKVYAIGGAQKCADKFIDCSPFEVLAYFKNSELIVTDTFHGSIFSIITHSKFVTLVRKSIGNGYGNEEKITDLLKRLELKDRITYELKKNMEKIISNKIDYERTDRIIENERIEAENYLKKEIKGEV